MFRSTIKKIQRFLPSQIRHQIIRKQASLIAISSDDIVFKLATTAQELEEAYALLHDCYVKEGYMKANPSGLRCTIFHALPQAAMLIGTCKGRVITTVTLIKDSPLGLPSDKEYAMENNSYRKRSYQLCEVSALATHPDFRGQNLTFHLIKYLWHYATDFLGATMLCCVVNPKALDFYKAFLNFTQNGKETTYDFVEGAEGVHITRDLLIHKAWMKEKYSHEKPQRNLYNFFYKEASPFEFPKRSRVFLFDPVLTPAMLKDFFSKKTDVFSIAKDSELELVKSAYALNFDMERSDWIDSGNFQAESKLQSRVFRYPVLVTAVLSSEQQSFEQFSVIGKITDICTEGLFFQTEKDLEFTRRYQILFEVENQKLLLEVEPRWQSGSQNRQGPKGYGLRLISPSREIVQLLKNQHRDTNKHFAMSN